ncbi:tetratricopeptide repeat protein [bacterium]|nr:tetratricopeptide repeat protein [bacterium]
MRALFGFLAIILLSVYGFTASKGLEDLKSIVLNKVDKSGTKTARNIYEYKIVDESGRIALANFRLRFLGENKNFRAVNIYSLTDNKKTVTAVSDIKFSDVQNSSVGITDLKMALIPIHNLKIGSVVHIEYDVISPAMAYGHMNDSFGFQNDRLAQEEYHYYESELPLKTLKEVSDKFYTVKEWQKESKYFLEIKPTPFAYETEGKNINAGYITISTSQSWEQLSQYFSLQYKKVWDSKLPPEYQQIVSNAAKYKTTSEKIEYAGQEISKLIAYSGTWTNPQNKLIPQDFAKLLKSKTGDCKDYSASLVAVLRALKIEAYPALVNRSNIYSPKLIKEFSTFPQLLAFNHVIVWATDETKKVWWVDPTNPMVFAENISSDILGKFSLVLDGVSKDVKFLPESNSIANNLRLELLLKINDDNTVFGAGKLVLNESSYNSIGQLERLKGIDGIKPVINLLLEPTLKVDVDVVKNKTTRIPSYSFSYVSPSFIVEKLKSYKAVVVANAAYLPILKIRANEESNLGEVGEFKSVTKILNAKAVDSYMSDCYARTPWIDAERFVENKKDHILVTDIVRTKKKVITKEEALSEAFQSDLQSLKKCYTANSIFLMVDLSSRSPARVELDKKLGPDVYEMTEQQADELYAVISDEAVLERYTKLLKYYNIKLAEKPNEIKYLARKSQLILDIAGVYTRNDITSASMISDSLAVNEKALQLNKGKYHKEIYKSRIYANLKLKNFKTALSDLKTYVANEPDKFSSYEIAVDSSYHQKNYELAERLSKAALKLSKTSVERSEAQKRLAVIYSKTKKYKEAIALREEISKDDPKNPWVYYDLASLYIKISDYDKAIDYAKKSLDIADLSQPKEMLSYLYYSKAEQLKNASKVATDSSSRLPASTSSTTKPAVNSYNDVDYEKFLIESYKWNKKNFDTVYQLSMYYLKSHVQDKNNLAHVSKAKYYSGLMMEIDPNNKLTREVSALTKKISTTEAAIEK